MSRSLVIFAVVMGTALAAGPALADAKSDCKKGIAMIKAELKKKHPPDVIAALKKALSDAEGEVVENDWSECLDYVAAARKALGK
jgi:hypothetical protein